MVIICETVITQIATYIERMTYDNQIIKKAKILQPN